MTALFANNAVSRLAASLGSSDALVTVLAGHGSRFPAPTEGQWFPISVIKDDGSLEIMHCTGRSGGVLTVTRAQGGTAALDFEAGCRVELRATSEVFQELFQRSELSESGEAIATGTPEQGRSSLQLKTGAVADVVGSATSGAIIERGSNANGSYVRFADGTQLCWAAALPILLSDIADAYWQFPASFVDGAYYTTMTIRTGSSTASEIYVGNRTIYGNTGDGAGFYVLDLSGRRVSGVQNVDAFSIGRWK